VKRRGASKVLLGGNDGESKRGKGNRRVGEGEEKVL